MTPRLIFIHGNGSTTWAVPWAVWLKQKLEAGGYQTYFKTMPDPKLARKDIWLPHLKDVTKAGPNDVLIGWSSGAVAAMRYAETYKIAGSILISPCYTDLNDDMEKQSGYYEDPWNWQQIKKNQKKIALVWGDDDPYIPQAEFAYIAVHLSPEKIKLPGGRHFEERQDFPELLKYIEKTYPL